MIIAGTQVGDFQEASGIYNAFFGAESRVSTEDVLHVGSIKTVIGRKFSAPNFTSLSPRRMS